MTLKSILAGFLVFLSFLIFQNIQIFSQSACKIDACNCCGQEGIYYQLLDSVDNVVGSWYSDRNGCAFNIGGTSWPEGATYHIRTFCPNGDPVIDVYITGCVCGFTSPYQMVDLPCCPVSEFDKMGNNGTPKEFILNQNYPNPFNPITKITFELPAKSEVTLTIYDIAGKTIVQPIYKTELGPGSHQYIWNTTHSELSSGIYFYKLSAGEFTSEKKMVLVK